MAYTALYREWRPQSFEEVVGQPHVTRTLRNALASGAVAHAYLFCGPRGTGKTSVARILAKAVNCETGITPTPCQVCPSCEAITAGSSMDVLEIDGASNRGIDEVRDLREKLRLAPAASRRKVYIIDEVHQLTEPAFNALLKTLEEPPAHVLFILATTDPNRIPVTILSRCQRFDFHRLGARQIVARLEEVCRRHGLDPEPGALEFISRQAEGSLRDALSLLDQSVAYAGPAVTGAAVEEILGAVAEDARFALADTLLAGDVAGTLRLVAELVDRGKDLRQLAVDLTGHFRDLLVAATTRELDGLVDLPEESWPRLQGQAELAGAAWLAAATRQLGELVADLRFASQPRVLLEVALVGLAAERAPVTASRTGTPEPSGTAPAPPAGAETGEPGPVAAGAARAEVAAAACGAPAAASEVATAGKTLSLEELRRRWPELLERVGKARKGTAALLAGHATPVAVDGRSVVVGFTLGVMKEQLERPSQRSVVEKALQVLFGDGVTVRCALVPSLPEVARESGPRDEAEAEFDAPGDEDAPPAGPDAPVPPEDGEDDRASGRRGDAPDPVRKALDLFGGEIVDGEA